MADPVPYRPPLPAEPDPSIPLPEFEYDAPPEPLEQGVRRGLRFLHVWMSETRSDAWTATMNVETLLDLLIAKGVITAREFEQRKQITGPVVQKEFEADPLAPHLNMTADKYRVVSPPIDCESRIPLCKARCCSFRFALSTQDLDEGIVRWDYAHPYINAVRASDGYCTHCQPGTFACGVYAHRPAICRQYDCRNDKRIWKDFEARIPADFDEAEAGTEQMET
jgi:Fe-S-cluster containining protein